MIHTRTARFSNRSSAFFLHKILRCFERISKQRAVASAFSLNWLYFIFARACVYLAVCNVPLYSYVKVKQSRYRPGLAQKIRRFLDFMRVAQGGGKIVSLTHRLPLPPGNAPDTHFGYRLSRPQGHSSIGRILYQWKIPMTPPGIETATFRFVAQHLNHCATAVPTFLCTGNLFVFELLERKDSILEYKLCQIFIINSYISLHIINPLVFQYKRNVFFEVGNHLDERRSLT